MHYIALAVVGLLFLQVIWPILVTKSVHDRTKQAADTRSRGEQLPKGLWLQDHVSWIIVLLGVAIAGTAYIADILLNNRNNDWWNAESAVTALGLSIGTLFATARLLSPPISVAWLQVTDEITGLWNDTRYPTISIAPGIRSAVELSILNCGIAPWMSYRITVRFPSGFVLNKPSKDWAWASRDMIIRNNPPLLRQVRSAPLAVAEPHVIMFFLTGPAQTQQNTVEVSVVADGRLGSTTKRVAIEVAPRGNTHGIP